MSTTRKYLFAAPLATALAWCAGVHLFFLFHASPARDDFNRASVTGPLIHYVIDFHQTWSGRWSATALQIALGRNFDLIKNYPWLLLIFTGLFLAGCLAFSSLVVRKSAGPSTKLGVASLFAALIWLNLPEPGEVLYWLTGAIEYLLPVMCGVILLAWLPRAEASWLLRRTHAAALAAFTIFITGLHDVLGLYLVFVLGLILFYRVWRKTKPGLVPLLILVAAAGFVLTIWTPGVAARREAYAALAPNASWLLLRGILKTLQVFCSHFLLAPSLILAGILALSCDFSRVLGTEWIDRDRRFFRFALPLLTILSPLGLMLIVMLSGLYDPPPRLIDAAFIIFIFGWVLSLIAWMPVEPEQAVLDSRSRRLRAAVFVLFVISFFTTANSYRAASDAVMRLRPWTEAVDSRNAFMRQAAQQLEHIKLRPLPPRPALYPDTELFADPNHPLNQGYAAFFGVASVKIAGERNHAP